MNIMVNPARWAMYSFLRGLGPMRASDLMTYVGVSEERVALRHLRIMEEVGYVRELDDHHASRFRRWEALAGGVLLDDAVDDSAYSTAALERWVEVYLSSLSTKVKKWASDDEAGWEHQWRANVFVYEQWLHLTPSEMEEFHEQFAGMLREWRDRSRARLKTLSEEEAKNTVTPVFTGMQAVPMRWAR